METIRSHNSDVQDAVKRAAVRERGNMDVMALVVVPGKAKGQRIAAIRWYEMGYYPQYFDRVEWTEEQAQAFCDGFNSKLGIERNVADSAMAASMFGWHIPAAKPAIEFFKTQN